jgi:glucose-fructose oxidoreductase
MRFPDDRLGTFTASFGAADLGMYQVCGTEGDLRLEPAFSYSGELVHHLTLDGKTTKTKFRKRDQFAAEIDYFSDCVLNDTEPEPSGEEGLSDVRIIRALYHSALTGQSVKLTDFPPEEWPGIGQEIHRAAVEEPDTVHAESPHA